MKEQNTNQNQEQNRGKKKKLLILLLALLLLCSTVGGATAYRYGLNDTASANLTANAEMKEIDDTKIPMAAPEEEQEAVIEETQIPLAGPAVAGAAGTGTVRTAGLEAVPAADAEELAVELAELTSVMETMLAAPTPAAVTETVVTAPETEAAAPATDPAAEEAARQAAEAARQAAIAKAEKAAELEGTIAELKNQLEEAKGNTAAIQEQLRAAKAQYETAMAAANEALAKAQDQALALYNMKYAGIAELGKMSETDDKQNKNDVYSYFHDKNRKDKEGEVLDSTGKNFGVPVTGQLKNSLSVSVDNTATTEVQDDQTTVTLDDAAQNAENPYEFGFKIIQHIVNGQQVNDIIWTEVDYSKLALTDEQGNPVKVPVYYYDAVNQKLVETTMLLKEKPLENKMMNYLEIDPDAVIINEVTGIQAAKDVADQMQKQYDSSMLSYNEDAINQALAAQQTAQEALNAAVLEEVKAIEAEQGIVENLNETIADLTVVDPVKGEAANENAQPSAPVATPEEIEDAKAAEPAATEPTAEPTTEPTAEPTATETTEV